MASDGRELKDIIPSDESDEYQHVKDEAVKAVLKHIFHMVCEASSVPRDNLQEVSANNRLPVCLLGSVVAVPATLL